jgi:hypothetical protein
MRSLSSVFTGHTFDSSGIAQPNAQNVTFAVACTPVAALSRARAASCSEATGGTSMRGKPRVVITSPFPAGLEQAWDSNPLPSE